MDAFSRHLMTRKFKKVVHEYSLKDTILYSLGVGVGFDPRDSSQLKFVYEDGLRPMPSMAVVLAHPGFWAKEPDTGIDWVKLLHVGQEFELHESLPEAGKVYSVTRVVDVLDKGADKGAIIISERVVKDFETNSKICTVRTTSFARGNGGFSEGGKVGSKIKSVIPDRECDIESELDTFPNSALIYRLSGDLNPLHASPEVAKSAGFDGPILHGLCTFGVSCHAILRSALDYDDKAVKKMGASFTSPVYPGDTVVTKIWEVSYGYSFQCFSKDSGAKIIDNGFVVVREGEI
ncbi:MaoC/PaaZ C-terminal domain-containing protein [Halomonas ventosae]|uniref:Acyl dehydratase n=1 Tax=Halomonas ventosae TaxID=229007 RepID=A0A4R6H4S6_9GAMM|nr:MaoC/PaaZ C-terminal domain-containing protein [Halomonas ventosae]TDO02867.1 acyl dehydratase [Halomonas ventosae]